MVVPSLSLFRGIVLGVEASTSQKIQGAKILAKDELHNARDFGKQVGLEVKKKARDTGVAIEKTAPVQAALDAKPKLEGKLSDAKEKVLDAVLPATKTVEAESFRGVDITHVENAKNVRLEELRREEVAREAEIREREQEKKRQEVADAAFKKGQEVKESIKETASTVSEAVTSVAHKAGVVAGNAAVSVKEKLDDYSDDRPRTVTHPARGPHGIDTTAMENARNEEILAEHVKIKAKIEEKRKMSEPSVGEKIKSGVEKVSREVEEAAASVAGEPTRMVYVRKMSNSGVDISHVENANNAHLAALEEEQLRRERELALQSQQANIEGKVIDPAAAKAKGTKNDLSQKLNDLGQSISRAATKVGNEIKAKWDELAHPVPLDIHEKKSESGVDTTSIANAENNRLGEQYKAKHSVTGGSKILPPAHGVLNPVGPSVLESKAPEKRIEKEVRAAPDTETAVVKTGLDTGVEVKEDVKEMKLGAAVVGAQAKEDVRETTEGIKEGAKELAADTKMQIKQGVNAIKQDVKETVEKVKEKVDVPTGKPGYP
jgi:hypothetical protein